MSGLQCAHSETCGRISRENQSLSLWFCKWRRKDEPEEEGTDGQRHALLQQVPDPFQVAKKGRQE